MHCYLNCHLSQYCSVPMHFLTAIHFGNHRCLANHYRLAVNRFPMVSRSGNCRCLANRYRLVVIRFPMVSYSGSPMASRDDAGQ